MKWKLDFSDPASVVAESEIASERVRLARKWSRVNLLAWPFLGIGASFVFWVVEQLVIPGLALPSAALEQLTGLPYGEILALLVAAIAVMVFGLTILDPFMSGLLSEKEVLRPLYLCEIHETTKLCEQHPELNAWRICVAEKREFVLGDLRAMQRWAAKHEGERTQAAGDEEYRAAKQALHALSPVSESSAAQTHC